MKKEVFYELGKRAAYESAMTSTSSKLPNVTPKTNKKVNGDYIETLDNRRTENILPALAFGGTTSSGNDQLYQSTLPK